MRVATPISEAGKGLLSCGGEVIGAGSETSPASVYIHKMDGTKTM